MRGGEEVAGHFVVARGNRAELLDFAEGILDQVTLLGEMPGKVSWATAMTPRWNDGGLAGGGERLENALVGIEAVVGDQQLGLHIGQEVARTNEVVRLAGGQ